MEAFEGGTLAAILVPEGGKVKVGDAIAVLATGAEKPEDVRKQFAAAGATRASDAGASQPPGSGEQSRTAEGAGASVGGNVSKSKPSRQAATSERVPPPAQD